MLRNNYEMSADASNHDLQNVECQSLLPSCKISSRSPTFAKRAITNVSDVLGVACVSSDQRRHVVWLADASQCVQKARVANFPASFSFYGCVTMDGNPAFKVHSSAHAFRAAITFNSMLLRQQIWCSGNYWSLMVWLTSCWNGFDVV